MDDLIGQRWALPLLVLGGLVMMSACEDEHALSAADPPPTGTGARNVPSPADGPHYAASVSERPTCEILTSAMVSQLFDVPAEALHQSTMFGTCAYTMTSGSDRLKVQLSNLTVSDGADLLFHSATSGDEYRDVPDLGSAARIELSSGFVTILHGNLSFVVTAYHGAPRPDTTPGRMPSMDELTQEVDQWVRATIDERQEAGAKVGRAVLAALAP